MAKYKIVESFGIINAIAVEKPFTVVIKSVLPDFTIMDKNQLTRWANENNNRMQKICDYMNANNL